MPDMLSSGAMVSSFPRGGYNASGCGLVKGNGGAGGMQPGMKIGMWRMA